ncbi:MAG: nrdA [Acidimicrobiaceae bacterium]|nr:nrdA [Acidimicrobiaceae bacterium]
MTVTSLDQAGPAPAGTRPGGEGRPVDEERVDLDPTVGGASPMRVRKRDGSLEPVDVGKIVRAVARCANGLEGVDPMRVATRTISGLCDGATTTELDELSIRIAAAFVTEEPNYSRLAARLLGTVIEKEVRNQDIQSFSQSVAASNTLGLVADGTAAFVSAHSRKLDDAVRAERGRLFELFGLRTVYDRYLLRHPETREVLETPQYFFLRVACGLSSVAEEAIELYEKMSLLEYMPSSPTLFNSGTVHSQMSSCYLLDSPADELDAIYERYGDVARLSKHAGGIGVAFHRIRARGSLIRGTNGLSNGIVPWLKTLDASVAAVNQCFAPNTLVMTAEGPRQIGEVEERDLVLGIAGEMRKVTQVFAYENDRPMVSITTKHSVQALTVTDGHPFYAIQGIPLEQTNVGSMTMLERGDVRACWTPVGDLLVGDYVAQPVPTEFDDPGLSVDEARLYGILLGDGSITKGGHDFKVSCSTETNQTTIAFIKGFLDAREIHFWTTLSHEGVMEEIGWAAGIELTRDAKSGRLVSRGQSHLPFGRVDLYDEEGQQRIGRRFMFMNRPQTTAMLHGLIESDGGLCRGNEVHFYNSSVQLAEGFRFQALRLGIPTSGQISTRDTPLGESTGYDIRLPAVESIARELGITPIEKRNWLEWQGCIWSRVTNIGPAPSSSRVYDLEVEGAESYLVASALVHNGGRRKGAACVYLETWHADIEEFLELRDSTGDEARRAHNLNIANWVPDLFMERVEKDWIWSLFDPKKVPHLTDCYGEEFERAYLVAEQAGLYERQVPARQLYGRMMRTLAQTGNGWMTFKDPSNARCNQTGAPGNTVHLSNLCTEILEVTSAAETAVCNLGSINLGRLVDESGFRFDRLGEVVRLAVTFLDRVVDVNYYPTEASARSNARWRPVGLGVMGLQDAFFRLRLPFDSPEARLLSKRIAEEIYFNALLRSTELAEQSGAHPAFPETRAAAGALQFDLWGVEPENPERFAPLRDRIRRFGLRNSLLVAIAPTATIASISGCYECIEPQVSNLFKRETLSGEFLQVNTYLVRDLQERGLWTEEIIAQVRRAEGSIQHIEAIPADLRELYRTAWEVPMRSLIDMAAERGPFVDQSQSLNLFVESPTIGKLSSMYLHAWKKGLKTTYYLRSRPATRITQTGAPVEQPRSQPTPLPDPPPGPDGGGESADVTCSLENPETCEACQ